jgi:hypothetical protein
LFGFFSGALHYAAEAVQWSPLMSAALVVPVVGLVFVGKPTIGAALFIARPSWWPIVGGVVFGGIAFALHPGWVGDWLGAIRANDALWSPAVPYHAPIQMPGGFLALLCLLRWRRPEARLVAALACVPQNLVLYEALPLFLVPRTFTETAALVGLSYVMFWAMQWTLGSPAPTVAYVDLSAQLMVPLMYLPCVLMVLRRPNVTSAA